jgi:hypothetical protein
MKKAVKVPKVSLIIESTGIEFWGRVNINNHLIVDVEDTIPALIASMKKVIYDIVEIKVESFDISFDLTTFFEQHSYLNISTVATRAGISPILMRQYASGNKFPSVERVKTIETAIREIGKELGKAKLHKSKREVTGK